MRIAYLVGTYPAVSHTFIAREVDGLRSRGFSVQTFSVRTPGGGQLLSDADRRRAAETRCIQPPEWGTLIRAHLRALSCSPLAWLSTLGLALRLSPGGVRPTMWQMFYFLEAILIWDWCREREIGHLHAHFANSAAWIAMLAADFSGDELAFSFTMHGPTEFDDVTRYRLAEKVKRARFVVCISDFCRSQLMKVTDPEAWPKLKIVHCGIDCDDYRPASASSGDDANAHGEGPLQVLCVGRAVPAKGQHVLIGALARLRERGVPITLDLVGDGSERRALEQAARDKGVAASVRFHGAESAEAVRDRMSRCDVFCLPSLAEGVPVVLMEAMAMEVPVLSTRIMGIPELVDDGESGLLVAPGDENAVADALERLAHDGALGDRLGSSARRKIMAQFNLEHEVNRLAALFQESAC